jgi:uncharacterized membrane protein YdjX (TVP38/TMEM64 family)
VGRQQEYGVLNAPALVLSRQASSLARETTTLPQTSRWGWLSPRTVRLAQLALVLGVAGSIALAYALHPGIHTELDRAVSILARGDGAAIGDYLRSYGVWAPLVSLLLMVVQAVAAPVPAVLVAFANGLTFGVVGGGLMTVAGQSLAAVVCFGIARALGRAPVEALAGKLGLAAADRRFAKRGARGVFLLRLVPGISFDVVSYGAGLTGIRFVPFIGATALGVAPQAYLYAFLIREAPQSAWLFYAASWLAVSGVVMVAIVRARRRPAATPSRRDDSVPHAACSA